MFTLSHIAIVYPHIQPIIKKFESLGLLSTKEMATETSHKKLHKVPEEGVSAFFIPLSSSPHLGLELLEPLPPSTATPGAATATPPHITRFIDKHPQGGIHHLCFEVPNIHTAYELLINAQENIEIIPPGIRKGARGQVFFIHPRTFGILIEVEQIE